MFKFIALKTKVYRYIIPSRFETKLTDYMLFNIVDEIFTCKIRLEFKNKKNMHK